jgi:Domain of unknown function (DUF4160)
MPEISRFYGIIIKLFFSDHSPPHFHDIYGEYNALFDIQKMELLEGDLPNRAYKLVKEWGTQNQAELLNMWNNQQINKLPPLK